MNVIGFSFLFIIKVTMAAYWSTSQDHLQLAQGACSKSRCLGLSFERPIPSYSKTNFVACCPGDGVDCSLAHMHKWILGDAHSTQVTY